MSPSEDTLSVKTANAGVIARWYYFVPTVVRGVKEGHCDIGQFSLSVPKLLIKGVLYDMVWINTCHYLYRK